MADKMQMLKQKISAANLTVDELAVQIGMNPSTFYRKTKSGVDAFTVGEMHNLVDALKLTGKEAKDIFLASSRINARKHRVSTLDTPTRR